MFIKVTTIILICFSMACTSKSQQETASNPGHLHGTWELVSAFPDTADVKKGSMDSSPNLVIDTVKKTIGGYSGCNSFGGDYTATTTTIKIGELIATQRGCLESIEPVYFNNLRRIDRYRAVKDSLKLYSMDTLLLSFIRVPVRTE